MTLVGCPDARAGRCGAGGASRKPMPGDKKDEPFSLQDAAKALQDNVSRSGSAAAVSYTLIGAIVLFGGLGYACDSWRGTAPWGVFTGLMLGIVVGFYELIKTIWRR